MAIHLVLASKSPRRKEILQAAGISFDIITADTPEDYPEGLAVKEIPVHIATNKALAVARLVDRQSTVLAADTIVALDQQILGKPKDLDQAAAFLRLLSGKTHQVITGVCILDQGQKICLQQTTQVCFLPITDAQIQYYVEKYKPLDKAGAYAIQEWIGMVGIAGIEGDYYNVVGLPIARVSATLSDLRP